MKQIRGNTFPVKDQLRALGGRWNAAEKCWEVPDEKESEAQQIPAAAPRPAAAGNADASSPTPNARETAGIGTRTVVTAGAKAQKGTTR